MKPNTMLETGLVTRREVLGRDYVDRSLAQAGDFARPLQELVTEYCWLTNGVTPREIQEALLQTAIYCGVPAAMEATRTAEAVLEEQGLLESTP